MNNTDIIQSITPILTSYISFQIEAEAAMSAIGRTLKDARIANPATDGQDLPSAPTGYHVFDRTGNPFSYPAAAGFDIDDEGRLAIRGDGQAVLALFNRMAWTHLERIAPPSPRASADAGEVHISTTVDANTVERMIADADTSSHFSRRGR